MTRLASKVRDRLKKGNERRRGQLDTLWMGGHCATTRYRDLASREMGGAARVFQAGCGWDRNEITLSHRVGRFIVGLDLDERVAHRYHSPFTVGSLDALPFPDDIFDLVLSDYVVEHLSDPDRSFDEMSRVLAPGGRLLVLTPNVLSYKSLAAAVLPHSVHERLGRLRYGEGAEQDMYPTLYRCNTPNRLAKAARDAGLRDVRVELISNGPTWFLRFPGLFGLGAVFHRLIERVDALARLRCAMILSASKSVAGT